MLQMPNTPLNESEVERRNWVKPVDFILACLGYAVGLGNVWRFPFLCYRNGGVFYITYVTMYVWFPIGAFLIPFSIMLIFIGLPIFYMELYIGQYSGLGPLKAFPALSPFFSGLGYCSLIVISLIIIYYMIIVAWILFYIIVSVTGELDWGSCDNNYNSKFCYSVSYDKKCRTNNTGSQTDLTYYLKKCMSIGEICKISGFQPDDGNHCLNGTDKVPWYTNVTRVLAAEQYYNEQVLGLGDASWTKWGTIQWHLVGCLAVSWMIAFLCVIRGVQASTKVIYFTSTFPYIMLTVLLVRGITLEGAIEGLHYYVYPKWGTLLRARVWGDAASQIYYSFGVACGSLITLASYNKFTNNCHFDAVIVSIANFFTSIYAGFAIFSVLGFQAQLMGVSVDLVATSGPGLAFVTYPEAILQMPVPRLWAILFFFMLFILGLGSQFAGIEVITSSVVDQWPTLRNKYWMVTGVTCAGCFILGLPMCYSGGVNLFTLLDWNTASWAVMIVGIAESASVAWCYGSNRALRDLSTMNMKHSKFMQFYWKTTWNFTIPIGSSAILIFVLADWRAPSYEDYIFPWFANALGWMISISTIILLPVGVCWAYYGGYKGKKLFIHTERWKAQLTHQQSHSTVEPPKP